MDIQLEAQRTLTRILTNVDFTAWQQDEQTEFESRLQQHFPRLFALLFEIYGHRYDFYFHVQELVQVLAQGYSNRPGSLKKLDCDRLAQPDWYLQKNMLGMACYVDLFAGDLAKLKDRIGYLAELGVTYLHLMPLYKSPEGDSDGGYAVSDYRTVDPALGTTEDLRELAEALADAGICLVLDFVFNHTSDEHEWATLAKQGDAEHQEYYYMFPDRTLPDAYEENLREIFPQVRRGNFTWDDQSQRWVWTTFNSFQWDLNYGNPAVFNAITGEMLFLANLGCSVLRLDALAFIWKEMGTNCENQAKAHSLIKAFNACLQIAAPAVVFKSEAIVHPDEVVKYIDPDECQLSYNPLLMALIWESLATRKTQLLTESMRKSFAIHPDCAWVNYVRCHDDIGWTFDDTVAHHLGVNGYYHRHFLNAFYTGRFEGSFAQGVAFQENPSTGDCRVCGSAASLAGLEQAKQLDNPVYTEHAIARLLLMHSIILSIGGIPLLYSGDEIGLLNDYSYQQDPTKQHDGRWVQRIALEQADIAKAKDTSQPEAKLAQGLQEMIKIRKQQPLFGHTETHILQTNNQHVFAYARHDEAGNTLLALCNFSEHGQHLDRRILDMFPSRYCRDLLAGKVYSTGLGSILLNPYQVLWLVQSSYDKKHL